MFLLDYFLAPAPPPAFRARLPGGLPVLVRHVGPADAERLREGFRQISGLARRRHFPGEDVRELGDEHLRPLAQVDQQGYCIWGALNPASPAEPGIGIARYRRLEDDRTVADAVITVLDRYQGTGAGVLLHACLHATASRNGIRHFQYEVDSSNERFIRHLRNLGAEQLGRVVGVTRLKMPVYRRALSVPHASASGLKFSRALRLLTSVQAAAA